MPQYREVREYLLEIPGFPQGLATYSSFEAIHPVPIPRRLERIRRVIHALSRVLRGAGVGRRPRAKGSHMKHSYIAAFAISSILGVHVSLAQELPVTPGVSANSKAGASGRSWTATEHEFDFGLGWLSGTERNRDYMGISDGPDRVHFRVDHPWESFESGDLPERSSPEAGYSDFEFKGDMLDIEWQPYRTPIERFLGFGPSLYLITPSGIPLDPGIGARYVF